MNVFPLKDRIRQRRKDLGLSRRLYKQSYHVYQGIGDAFRAECLREEAEAQLNGPLD